MNELTLIEREGEWVRETGKRSLPIQNNVVVPDRYYYDEKVFTFDDIDRIFNLKQGVTKCIFFECEEINITEDDYYIVDRKDLAKVATFEEIMLSGLLKSRKCEHEGYIYFAVDPTSKAIKIGRTKHEVKKRISTLNIGRSDRIVNFEYHNCRNTVKAEREIHQKLKEKHIVGEWFNVSLDEARNVSINIISSINKQCSYKTDINDYNEPFYVITYNGFLKIAEYLGVLEQCQKKFDFIQNSQYIFLDKRVKLKKKFNTQELKKAIRSLIEMIE